MQLLLAPRMIKRLERELRRAGSQEIGGLLMGEHVGDDTFRMVEFTVQRSGGTIASFLRNPTKHQAQLRSFFSRTGEYTRFNYLGEWHSHPSFEPRPSGTDVQTMQSIADDPDVGANFVVLLITRLSDNDEFEATATVFRPCTEPVPALLIIESVQGRE
jgi:integrative and conjugative element protein (TIGR02256 family)